MKSERALYEAAIESGHIFNHAVREAAQTSGLLKVLETPRSVDDVVRVMGFLPERADQIQHLLRMLRTEGYLSERTRGETPVFEVQRGAVDALADAPDGGRYRERAGVIEPWFGEGHVERIRSANKALLGPNLDFFRSPHAAIRFNRQYEDGWRTNLTNPLYEFGRLLCVQELTKRGNRFLDLACGPGYGVQRLAEFTTGACSVVGVDKSRDFLQMASETPVIGAHTRFIERDLNTGLPPLPAQAFDGVLFNGAFHFIADKPARLREIWRVLRPGGAVAIGHCFSHSGFADQSMHDLYFSLLSDRAYVLPWATVRQLVEETGFAVYKEFHRGSHSYLIAERPATATDDAQPTAMTDAVVTAQTRGGLA